MASNGSFERVIRLASGICVGASGATAFFVLLTWITGKWTLGTLGAEYVPMAPSTAVAVVFLSLSVFLNTHRPGRALSMGVSWFSVVCTTVMCALALVSPILGLNIPFTEWMVPVRATVGGFPVGVMSPLAAVVVLLSAVALAFETPPLGRSRTARRIASALALLGGMLSVCVFLGYVMDAPMLYDTNTIPMSLLSGIALALLSVGLIHDSAPGIWPLSTLLFRQAEGPSRWTAKGPVGAFLFLFAAIVVVGGFQLETQQKDLRKAAQAELDAVADLKTQGIAHWRRECLGDAAFLAKAAFVAREVHELLSSADAGKTRAEVLDWLTLLKGGERYTSVTVFDAGGNVRLSIPESASVPGPKIRVLVADTIRENAVNMTDLHQEGADGAHLDLMVPVHAPGADPAVSAPVAVIAFRVNPRQYLFPFVQSWPAARATAETLMVRREGNEILFLNELRHLPGTAMKLRFPIDRPNLPAAMAVQGRTGLVEGADYRGEPVLAVLRKIPDSPWFLVAKMDQAEIYAASRRQAVRVAGIMALLVFISGLGIVALWRQRNLEHLRATLDQQKQHTVLARRFAHLMRQANDIILLVGGNGKIAEANDRAAKAYRRSQTDLQEMELADLHAPGDRAAFKREMARLTQNGSICYETEHRRADGSVFPVEVSARIAAFSGAQHQLFIVRDITERRERETEIDRLSRLYAALSHVNQAIVRSQTRPDMFDRVCEALVGHGGFQLAWIGRYDPQSQSVNQCTGRCQKDMERLELQFFTDNRVEGQGPAVCAAVRENRSAVCRDLAAAQCSPEVRREIDRAGIRASAALPIHFDGRIWGVLAVGAEDAGYFGPSEMALLEEASYDVSFALDHFERAAGRKGAEEQLDETRQRLALAVESARLGFWDWDLRTDAVHFSCGYRRQLGYDDGEFSGAFKHLEQDLHPDDREWTLAAIDELVEERPECKEIEFRLMHRDGSYRWILSRAVLQFGPGGGPERMIGCHIDITDRKVAVETLRRSEENLMLAECTAHVGFWEHSLDGRAIQWSDEACRMLGVALQERHTDLASFLAIVHPEDREAVSEALLATREEDKPCNIEYRIVRHDGTARFVHSQGELFLDAMGRPDRVFGTILDITARGQVEEAFRDSREGANSPTGMPGR